MIDSRSYGLTHLKIGPILISMIIPQKKKKLLLKVSENLEYSQVIKGLMNLREILILSRIKLILGNKLILYKEYPNLTLSQTNHKLILQKNSSYLLQFNNQAFLVLRENILYKKEKIQMKFQWTRQGLNTKLGFLVIFSLE